MAYAAVVALKLTLEGLLDSSRSKVQIPNSDLKLIHGDLCYLKSFFDKLVSLQDSNSVEKLEEPVKILVQNTQDLIESHISDVFHAGSDKSGDESSISGFSRDLMELKEKICSLTERFKTMDFTEDQKSTDRFAADVDSTSRTELGWNVKKVKLADVDAAAIIDFGRNNTTVGLDGELRMLQHQLLWGHLSRTIISIVGMGGIGKTTLAREVYLDPLIYEHFDIRVFVEIGQEYELRELLQLLLSQRVPEVGESTFELGENLYKRLYGRRYLIVLDDMWSVVVWDELKHYFPDNANGSAIIFTTRMLDLARYVSSEENILHKRFLDSVESWELLHKMAFLDMECPLELIEIGKEIAASLGGLPLAIVMIGKLLSKSERSVETWRVLAEDINLRVQETTILDFLNLSYIQLPQHLKACFLYLGLFPPNYDIPAAQLIKLWVAEGFIEPGSDKRLEQKAEGYLEDLVSRSFVIVQQLNSRGKIKTCGIHPILHEICVFEAQKEKLFHIVNKGGNSFPQGTTNQRRLGIHNNLVHDSKLMESVSAARSLVFMCPQNHDDDHQLQMYPRFRFLRVLHALSLSFREFPYEILKLVRLRYLAITYDGELPSSISVLSGLEVLIIHRSWISTVSLPLEIWKLHKLRHLEYAGCYLPDPSTAATGDGDGDGDGDIYLLEKLLTLSGVCAGSVTEGVTARMPNLMKLGIWFDEPSCHTSISLLHHLQSFKWVHPDHQPEAAASFLICFSSSITKISLRWMCITLGAYE